AILYYRKALALGLPTKEKENCQKSLARVYFFAGKWYSKAGFSLLQQIPLYETLAITQIYHVQLADKLPDWGLLLNHWPEEYIHFWKSLYFLKTKNYPKAWPLLQKLGTTQNIFLKNRSIYLTGFISQTERRFREALAIWSKLDLATFLHEEPWFFEQYYRMLLFYGYKKEAKAVKKVFEESSNSR
ncbi:MAG: hypothetical protein D6767_01640, partial [Candidatus Hydrogenedentota bacterium]